MLRDHRFPLYKQLDAMDCGPTCLRIVAKYYGKHFQLETLRQKSFITREGASMLGISDAAESIGFRTTGVMISFEQLVADAPLPCILHWKQNHFVVCYKIKKKGKSYRIYISDPELGLVEYDKEDFLKCWLETKNQGDEKGAALLLQPGPEFYRQEEEDEKKNRNLRYFLRYLRPYKSQLLQLVLGMGVVSILQLIFPFLTQSLVDIGIRDGDLSFITLILISQLVIFLARLSVEFIQGWILLHWGIEDRKYIIVTGTLSKAIGTVGGYITASQEIIDYLRIYARSNMFSTSLPPAVCASAIEVIHTMQNTDIVKRLKKNALYLRNRLKSEGFNILNTETAIVPLIVGNPTAVTQMAKDFIQAGILINGIFPPAVPAHLTRFRISAMASHTQADMDFLIATIIKIFDKYGLERYIG